MNHVTLRKSPFSILPERVTVIEFGHYIRYINQSYTNIKGTDEDCNLNPQKKL